MKLKIDFLKHALLLMALVIMGNSAMAQRTIEGTITDAETKEPLIGASVLVIGTSVGAITDFDGKYSLEVPDGSTELRFSYTGYATQTIELGASNVVDLAMSAGTVLDEVVVVGYGTQKTKEVTGSVASVKAEDFNKGNITDPSQLLQGKVAGLSISRPGGNPNGSSNIRLRGLSTVGQNAEPLVIVDGVPGADFNTIDPNDIESIDVLKDGSAASIYGTRAASGVIIVTTKSGRGGAAKVSVDYNGYITAENRDRTVDVLTAGEHAAYVSANNLNPDLNLGGATDWFDEITRTGVTNVHNLSISGGTNNSQFRASIGYRDIEGIALKSGFNQLNARVNFSQRALDDKLRVTLNVASSIREEQFIDEIAFRYATIFNPTANIFDDAVDFDPYGGYYQALGSFDYYNPVALIDQNDAVGEKRVLNMNVRGDYELIEGLTASLFFSEQRTREDFQAYSSKESFYIGAGRNGLASINNFDERTRLFEMTGNYETNIENVNLKFLAGYSHQYFNFQGNGMQAGNFVTDAFTYNNINAALDWSQGNGGVFSYRNDSRLIAFFGRVNANINDTYYLSASLRREGSSKFGKDRQWGLFPGISAGVNITKLVDIPSVDNMKLRIGYGVTGNLPENSYVSLSRISALGAKFFYNGAFVPSYGPVSNPNPNFQWETKSDINVGIDFSLLDYKINGSIEYYSTTTEDMIVNFPVPQPPNAFSNLDVNLGELKNSGLELALNINAITKEDFSWKPGITFNTYLTAELVSLSNEDFNFGTFRDISNLGAPGQNNTPTVRVEEGAPIGQIWGYNYEGLDDDGKWIFTDNNGDGMVNVEDRTVIGNGIPDFEFGINNSFTYKNFDFNMFFRGAVGHDLVNTFRAFYETPNNINSYNILNSGTDAEFSNFSDAPQFSDLYVEDASFINLDNVTLGYTVGLPDESKFSSIRLYVNAQNLFTITGYKGVDPNVRWTDTDEGDLFKLGIGIDRRNTYFTRKAFTFGLNVGF